MTARWPIIVGFFFEERGWGFQIGSRQRITSATINSVPHDSHFTSPPIRARLSAAHACAMYTPARVRLVNSGAHHSP